MLACRWIWQLHPGGSTSAHLPTLQRQPRFASSGESARKCGDSRYCPLSRCGLTLHLWCHRSTVARWNSVSQLATDLMRRVVG
jgi:hypothetical protein